ncbi:hypothetical protein ACFQGT_17005 [Natrialbaceae archaeon GCM10025810]|uniref:hypothetical protein n=1 Tax=Halovalidus salilacus TaxID=3075124 RepID=UPI00362120BB
MNYAVTRDATTLVTLHGGSDTTARDEAVSDLAAVFEELADDGTIDDWTIETAEVYEHPTAPFDPYTIAVSFAVTVTVEADDPDAAADRGADAIDDALEAAGIDSIRYGSAPAASVA